jgi:hypothetical protein
MSQYNEITPHRAFSTGGVAFGQFVRVKLSGSTPNLITLAGPGDKAIGITSRPAFTSDSVVDVILANADGTVEMTASGAITANATVYGDANGKVTATANGNPVGIALQATSNDGEKTEVLVLPSISGGKLFTEVAASSAVTNTTTETAFDQSFTIPANLLGAGDRLHIFAQGIATATNSTDTLNAKLYIGGTGGQLIAATGALDVANNDIFVIDADVVIRTAGVSGTLVASGYSSIGTPGTATAKPFNLASSAIDTTAAKQIAASATWSVANAGNSCRLDILNITRVSA